MFELEDYEGLRNTSSENVQKEGLSDAQKEYLHEVIPDQKDWLNMDYEQRVDTVNQMSMRLEEMQLPLDTIPKEYFEYQSDLKQLEQFQNIECVENCVDLTDYLYRSGIAEKYMEGDTITREYIAQDYFTAIKECMGLDPNMPLTFTEMPSGVCGGYNPHTNSIELNANYLEHADPRGLLKTIVHESEHAFQQKCVDNPSSSNVDPEVLDQWKYNMEHYKDAKTYGHEEYRNQAIEKDAFEFEKYVFAQVDKLKNLRD